MSRMPARERIEGERRNHARHGSRYGLMEVVGSAQFAGRLYRCPCGWRGWSTWGHAGEHAARCPKAQGEA